MGTCYLDGRPIGDDGRDAGDREYRSEHARSTFNVDAQLAALAKQSTNRGIKDRARRMQKDRFRLATVHGELVHASGARAVAIASACVEREERMPRRWGGFGGEVPLPNARAALLLARWERRFERADAEVEAA